MNALESASVGRKPWPRAMVFGGVDGGESMQNGFRTGLPTKAERLAAGRALRRKIKRGELGRWRPKSDRSDPIDLIEEAHSGSP